MTPAALQDALNDLIRRSKTPGLQYAVVNPAATVFEFAGGLASVAPPRPMQISTTLMAYSMSKTITAAAVLQLVDAGTIGIDDGVARYLDWEPYGPSITVRQLLSHTSGIPNPIPLRWVHAADAHASFDEHAALKAVLQKHGRLACQPGTKFAYSNIGYWLLGPLVERASGQAFTAYVEQQVLRRLDIAPDELSYSIANPATHAAGYLEKYSFMNLLKGLLIDRALIGEYAGPWLRIRDHYPNGPAFGGLVGSATGFAKFLQDQLREQSRLFSDRTRALFVQPQRIGNAEIPMTPGWHIGTLEAMRFFFKEGGGGGFHSMMRLYPDRKIGTVLIANATGMNVRAVLDRIDPLALRLASS